MGKTQNPSGRSTKVRASNSRKNKDTGEYDTEWSGYITFAGDAHRKLRSVGLKEKVQIIDCDVTTKYDEVKRIQYTNYMVWDIAVGEPKDNAPVSKSYNSEYGISDGDTPF